MNQKIKQFLEKEFKFTTLTLLDVIIIISIYELIGLFFK